MNEKELNRLICILPFTKANREAEAILHCLSWLTSSLLLGNLTVKMEEKNIYRLFTAYNFSIKNSNVKIFMRILISSDKHS
jgi:hypothetical protein